MSPWALLAVWMMGAAPADFSEPLRARGEKEAASWARLSSDGRQLLLEVEVVDTTPSASKDEVHSDHVELWFALEDLDAVGPTRFVTTGERRLFTVDGKADPGALDRSILMRPGDGDWLGGEDSCDGSELNARRSLGEPPSRRVSAFFGLAHLGLFPDGRPAVLYDRQQYAAAGLSPSLAPGDVRYEVQRTGRGYHIRARIQPGGLVFVPREGVRTLRARVDIIDAGAPGAPEVLRSSHPAPRWGEPSTFQIVKLARPLALQLVAGVPELSQPEQPELGQLPPYFMRVGAEWRGVAPDPTVPTDYSSRFCRSSVGEVTEHVFLQWKLGPVTPFAGPGTVRIPVRRTEEDDMSLRGVGEAARAGELILFRGERETRAVWIEGTTQGFRFQDGKPGAVVEYTGWLMDRPMGGMCGAADVSALMLWRLEESGPTLTPLLSWGSCSSLLKHGDQELADLAEAYTFGDGESSWPAYTWQQPGRKLRVKFADNIQVDVSWNARDGSGVEAHAVEPDAPSSPVAE
jgi:hypothetical protein